MYRWAVSTHLAVHPYRQLAHYITHLSLHDFFVHVFIGIILSQCMNAPNLHLNCHCLIPIHSVRDLHSAGFMGEPMVRNSTISTSLVGTPILFEPPQCYRVQDLHGAGFVAEPMTGNSTISTSLALASRQVRMH